MRVKKKKKIPSITAETKVNEAGMVKQDPKVESKMDVCEKKPKVVVDKKKGINLHVPVAPGFDLSGLVNIHFHFHSK